jgi:hypothetical protein
MRQASLLGAVAIVLLSNTIALIHAVRNRSGQPDAQIILTERELNYYPKADDTGVALNLTWIDPGAIASYATQEDSESRIWLNKTKLEELGFDCSMAPSEPNAYSFYALQAARTGFVAFEYDGPAWQSWVEWRERMARAEATRTGQKNTVEDVRRSSSRLVAIDAGPGAAALRNRHPDRNRVLILPAVIRINPSPAWPATPEHPGRPASLSGFIQETPSLIHVPKPFNDNIRALRQKNSSGYRVHFVYGSLLEPWVVGVEGY